MFWLFVTFDIASPAINAMTGRPLIRGGRPPCTLESRASFETSVRRFCDVLLEDMMRSILWNCSENLPRICLDWIRRNGKLSNSKVKKDVFGVALNYMKRMRECSGLDIGMVVVGLGFLSMRSRCTCYTKYVTNRITPNFSFEACIVTVPNERYYYQQLAVSEVT
jgi:hypothetical protein